MPSVLSRAYILQGACKMQTMFTSMLWENGSEMQRLMLHKVSKALLPLLFLDDTHQLNWSYSECHLITVPSAGFNQTYPFVAFWSFKIKKNICDSSPRMDMNHFSTEVTEATFSGSIALAWLDGLVTPLHKALGLYILDVPMLTIFPCT